MTREELLHAVFTALRETQRLSAHAHDVPMTEATVPIGDLPEFDSYNGVEATIALEERVGRPLPVNLFTDDATRRPLTVGAVVDRLFKPKTKEEP